MNWIYHGTSKILEMRKHGFLILFVIVINKGGVMEITINIKEPPEGYKTPRRGPLYLPVGDELVLIGECWCRAKDRVKTGGDFWIYSFKDVSYTV